MVEFVLKLRLISTSSVLIFGKISNEKRQKRNKIIDFATLFIKVKKIISYFIPRKALFLV